MNGSIDWGLLLLSGDWIIMSRVDSQSIPYRLQFVCEIWMESLYPLLDSRREIWMELNHGEWMGYVLGMSECGWMSRQNATGLSNGRILLHIIWQGERMENSNPLPLRMRKSRDTWWWSAFSQGLSWVSGNSKALDKYDTITTRGQCDMKGRRGRQLCVFFDQTAAASDAPPCQEYDDMVTHSHGYNGIAN